MTAVAGEEGSFGPVEARPAAEVGRTERFQAGQLVLRMAGVRIAAGLHKLVRQAPAEEWNIRTEAILGGWSYPLSASCERFPPEK
jgi:hypothetical protein